LIDDLLNLSRIGRSEMKNQLIDLSNMVKEIAKNLYETNPERQVEFNIQNGISVHGDERLMRIVIENLLGNAWKFTSKCSSASIEFGAEMENQKPVYFVHDNGAGFDMKYVSKLFGAFQRLHDAKEFSGTGIGLATVQRIIRRHGGKIWAEGEVENGATFYFTIS
jgi:light-regulated signal transduction histidine kinase (bacteriophytochrome)